MRPTARARPWGALLPALCAVHCLLTPLLAGVGLAGDGPPALRWALWAASGPLAVAAAAGRWRSVAWGGWLLWAGGLVGAGGLSEAAHLGGAALVAAAVLGGRCRRARCVCPCGEATGAWSPGPSTSATTASASPSSSAAAR